MPPPARRPPTRSRSTIRTRSACAPPAAPRTTRSTGAPAASPSRRPSRPPSPARTAGPARPDSRRPRGDRGPHRHRAGPLRAIGQPLHRRDPAPPGRPGPRPLRAACDGHVTRGRDGRHPRARRRAARRAVRAGAPARLHGPPARRAPRPRADARGQGRLGPAPARRRSVGRFPAETGRPAAKARRGSADRPGRSRGVKGPVVPVSVPSSDNPEIRVGGRLSSTRVRIALAVVVLLVEVTVQIAIVLSKLDNVDATNVEQHVADVRSAFLISTVFFLAGVIGMSLWSQLEIKKRMSEVSRAARSISEGELHPPVQLVVHDYDEI